MNRSWDSVGRTVGFTKAPVSPGLKDVSCDAHGQRPGSASMVGARGCKATMTSPSLCRAYNDQCDNIERLSTQSQAGRYSSLFSTSSSR